MTDDTVGIPIDTIPAVLEGVADAAEWAARSGAGYHDVVREAMAGWHAGAEMTPVSELGEALLEKLGRRVPAEEGAP